MGSFDYNLFNHCCIWSRNIKGEYNGITVGSNGVFSDSIRTAIQVEVTGKELEGKKINFEDVILVTSKGESYIPKKMSVIEKGVNIATIDFELEIKEIGGISGYWALTFPVKVACGEKIYTSNKQYFFGENKIVVGPIKSTISRTQIEVRDYFANKSIWTRVNMFYLEVNGKKYFADNFTDPLDQGENSIIDHKTYIVNFNTHGKEFSLNDEVYIELDEKSTIRNFPVVRLEGKRRVEWEIMFYNLDAVISVGYGVDSKKATQFRK